MYNLAATGNGNFAYWGGSTTPLSTVNRTDYSSDTTTAAAKGPLCDAREKLAAEGTTYYG